MTKLRTIKTKTAVLKERRDGWWRIVSGVWQGIPANDGYKRGWDSVHNEVQLSDTTIRKYTK